MRPRLEIAFAFAALLAACKGNGDSGATWPAPPPDGRPVVMEFRQMRGEGDDLKAAVRFFNFADKDVRGLQARLIYLDANGKQLDTFPWSQMANPKLIGSKAYIDKEVGAFIPEGTAKVDAMFREVEFTDGSKWRTSGE